MAKPLTPTVQALLKVIESQAEQLKAASEVLMYQRSQLEEKDGQIKLLTEKVQKLLNRSACAGFKTMKHNRSVSDRQAVPLLDATTGGGTMGKKIREASARWLPSSIG